MHQVNIEEGAFFSHCDPENPLCVDTMMINRLEFNRWLGVAVSEEDLDFVDVETHQTTVAKHCGVGNVAAGNNIEAVMLLRRLPVCFGLQLENWHLDMPRLRALHRALGSFTDEELALVDEDIALLLTPKKKNEVLLGHKALGRRVKDIAYARIDGFQPEPAKERHVTIRPDEFNEGNMIIDASIDVAAGHALKKCLKRIQREFNCSRDEAFALFIRGRGVEKVVLNIYAPEDHEHTGLFVPGVGFLDPADNERWMEMVSHFRDVSNYAEEVIAGYQFGERLGGYIKFRDGECQVPNCGRSVDVCDIDHIVNHRDGGPTSANNSGCLCRPHHAMKSFELLEYSRDTASGTLTWRMPDGTEAFTMEDGTTRIFTRSYGAKRRARIAKRIRERNRAIDDMEAPPF